MYKKQWTRFETQSLAYGTLRKALYPKYIVRGDDEGAIMIYRPTADTTNPEILLIIHVDASLSVKESGFFPIGDDNYRLVGGNVAYEVLKHVTPLLS